MDALNGRAKRLGLIVLYTVFYGGIVLFIAAQYRDVRELSKEQAAAYLRDRGFTDIIIGDTHGPNSRYYSGLYTWEDQFVSGVVTCRGEGGYCEATIFKSDNTGSIHDFGASRRTLKGPGGNYP